MNFDKKTEQQALMFANRLSKRYRHLKKWAQRKNIGAYRIYDRDIPEIPLVLDIYGDAVCGALYKRPYEKDETDENIWLSAMKESAAEVLGIDPSRIFLKQRQRQRGNSQYEKTAVASANTSPFELIVNEGNLVFKVNLSDYLDTGLFPDRRLLRAIIQKEASGKKVLNLFSYTGSFSVYAASGVAVSTDSVDLSNTYLAWARDNFSLNGFAAQMFPHIPRQEELTALSKQNKNRLIRADVLGFIEKAVKAKMKWDIIILDPPAFSNSKKMKSNFDLQRDIISLANRCLDLLSPKGQLFLSVNLRKTQIKEEKLKAELSHNALSITDLTEKTRDEDFKGKKIPSSFLVRVG